MLYTIFDLIQNLLAPGGTQLGLIVPKRIGWKAFLSGYGPHTGILTEN